MPKGSPNKQTIASEKYQKKAGYMVKSFKLKRDVVEQFEDACKKAGISQAAQITKMMNGYSRKEIEKEYVRSREALDEVERKIGETITYMKRLKEKIKENEQQEVEEILSEVFKKQRELAEAYHKNYDNYNEAYKKADE